MAYLRPDTEKPTISTQASEDDFPVPEPVWDFFRSVKRASALGDGAGVRIFVVDDTFEPRQRDVYHRKVLAVLNGLRDSRKAVLLDPDTGIAPKTPKPEHVTEQEIRAVWEELCSGDWLILYQHARRAKDWRTGARAEFAEACGASAVKTFRATSRTTSLARDVALFAVEKR